MKPFVIGALSLVCSLPIRAQEQSKGETDIEKELPIPSTAFIPPQPPREVPPIKIEAATSRKLPTHQITVIRADASTLPDIPQPPEPKPFVQGQIGDPHYMLSFGATVYDHRLSHVKWYDPRTKEHFEAWCAWDWMLLSPFPEIKISERVHSFHLFASNIDTHKAVRFGKVWEMPDHPELADLAFAITVGDADDAEAIRVLTTLRDYYTKHKERLILIRKAQEEYQAAAAAWHAANPPQPQSHTFWLKPHRGSRYIKEEGAR